MSGTAEKVLRWELSIAMHARVCVRVYIIKLYLVHHRNLFHVKPGITRHFWTHLVCPVKPIQYFLFLWTESNTWTMRTRSSRNTRSQALGRTTQSQAPTSNTRSQAPRRSTRSQARHQNEQVKMSDV